MGAELNETHDPALESWVTSANDPAGDFPIQNLPLCVFREAGSVEPARAGAAIGDQVLDLAACATLGLLRGPAAELCSAPALNGIMALGVGAWADLRLQLSRLLRAGARAEREAAHILIPQAQADLLPPASIGDYTDAYASIDHA